MSPLERNPFGHGWFANVNCGLIKIGSAHIIGSTALIEDFCNRDTCALDLRTTIALEKHSHRPKAGLDFFGTAPKVLSTDASSSLNLLQACMLPNSL